MRLADRMLATRSVSIAETDSEYIFSPVFFDALPQLPHLLIDNVMRYWAESLDYVGQFPWSKIPNVRPPFREMWMEGVMPATMVAEDQNGDVGRAAVNESMLGCAWREFSDRLAPGQARKAVMVWSQAYGARGEHLPGEAWNSVERLHELALVVGDMRRGPVKMLGVAMMGTTELGDVIEFAFAAARVLREAGNLACFLVPFVLAASFANCRNVAMRERVVPEKQRRAFEREHKRPAITYRVLEIDPLRQTLETEGRAAEVGLGRALHICRGHFKTFTPDHRLFGKIAGTYWWTPFVRGTEKRGVVVKDYSIGDATGARLND